MIRKKTILITVVVLVSLLIVGCSSGEDSANKLTVGATPVPHAEILEDVVKDLLAQEGIELEVTEFTDYVTPNTALAEGSIDANFFQHLPYLEDFTTERGLNLVAIANVHVEPIGLYSDKISSLDDLEAGAQIAIPNDTTNEGRALLLLAEAGLIELSAEAGLEATPIDIVSNPKNLEFRELEAAQLPRVLADVSAAVINTNYALEADLVPTEDALLIEGSESPYANILVVQGENKDTEKINKLAEALTSDQVREYIANKYQGEIVPAF